MNKLLLTLIFLLTLSWVVQSQEIANKYRWDFDNDGGITWKIGQNFPHSDNIEMSGKYLSAVVRYGVTDDNSLVLTRDIVWPMLRTIPNNTHASLTRTFDFNTVKHININGKPVKNEEVTSIHLDGKLTVHSNLNGNMELKHVLSPSTDLPVFCEKFVLVNKGNSKVSVEIPNLSTIYETDAAKGIDGSYRLSYRTKNAGNKTINPGDSVVFYTSISGGLISTPELIIDVEKELQKRDDLISLFWNNLVLETPNDTLNKAFAFAKIRASESIYQTKGGPMHGPGGLSYYAAIWANDQAEYVNPFFPFLGYDYGIESAINSYRHFARFMNDDYKPMPSSIIAEGTDIWNGAGDRGDAAMIAYGAARFALALGDKSVAEELWPLIEWCLEYNRRNLNNKGVVNSDSDELEGRFPAGKANLCTSSLYYDALISASYLGENLGIKKSQIKKYTSEAVGLKQNIENYFGANVMGFDTYQYYDGNDILRAWICIPLTVNIMQRKDATIKALFSPQLWTEDGLATQSGEKTFWDRATLYALRGVFAAGETERGLKFLNDYSSRRLLGEHVPYPVEAYPEGNQRHLSAESGLYCRIYTEGLFGIRPTGLNSLVLTPNIPDEWDKMALKNVHGFGKVFDIDVKRMGQKLKVVITSENKILKSELIAKKSGINIHFNK